MYLVEQGEVALVNPDKLKAMKYIIPNQLEPFLIVGRMAFIGDELLNEEEKYIFSSVAIQQPTVVYWCEKSKLQQSWNIIGKESLQELRILALQRQGARQEIEDHINITQMKSKGVQDFSSHNEVKLMDNIIGRNTQGSLSKKWTLEKVVSFDSLYSMFNL